MTEETRVLAKEITTLLDEKKAIDIVTIDIESLTVLTEAFVVASGATGVQVRALCDAVYDGLRDRFQRLPNRQEGYREGRWCVLDYGEVLVHIFHVEEREFYHMERLWEDGENSVQIAGE
jgi:ribosome-associated protein